MNFEATSWRSADGRRQPELARGLSRAIAASKPIHSTAHRTLHHVSLEAGATPLPGDQTDRIDEVVCKVFHAPSGARALLDPLKHVLGRSAAQREWNALLLAQSGGLAAPRPIARGRTESGEDVLLMQYIPGRSLLEGLATDVSERPAWDEVADALARSVRVLHETGLRHGDLHVGNCRLNGGEVVLLDFQRTRELRGARDRLDDLAQLEFSLERSGATEAMCQSLRARLGVGAELDAALIRFQRDYQRGRSRRSLREGRAWAAIELQHGARGVRDRSLDPTRTEILYEATHGERGVSGSRVREITELRRTPRVVVKRCGLEDRSFVTKTVIPGTRLRALADRYRGTAGARAFRRAAADRLLSDRAAPARAYLEFTDDAADRANRRQSWLLMEAVGDIDLDAFVPQDRSEATRIARDLGTWLAAQHARGLSHRDLKAGNIRLAQPRGEAREDGSLETPIRTPARFWLVDLEDLTGPATVPQSARVEALAQLNASLADAHWDAASRRAGLDAYHARLPFDGPLEDVAHDIVARSLARNHRFRGRDCKGDRGTEAI